MIAPILAVAASALQTVELQVRLDAQIWEGVGIDGEARLCLPQSGWCSQSYLSEGGANFTTTKACESWYEAKLNAECDDGNSTSTYLRSDFAGLGEVAGVGAWLRPWGLVFGSWQIAEFGAVGFGIYEGVMAVSTGEEDLLLDAEGLLLSIVPYVDALATCLFVRTLAWATASCVISFGHNRNRMRAGYSETEREVDLWRFAGALITAVPCLLSIPLSMASLLQAAPPVGASPVLPGGCLQAAARIIPRPLLCTPVPQSSFSSFTPPATGWGIDWGLSTALDAIAVSTCILDLLSTLIFIAAELVGA